MDFLQAESRFRELRQALATGRMDMSHYEREAAQLRVFGGDGAWWAIRQQDGMWVRWDGQAWHVADPPHRKATQVLMDKAPLPVEEYKDDSLEGVILKGEEALRQLLQTGRIRMESSVNGVRYIPVNLKPGGMLHGVAYAVGPDGSLNTNVAILYAAAGSAEEQEIQVAAQRPTVPPAEKPGAQVDAAAKTQAARDLIAAQVLETSSRVVDDLEERRRVLEVALRQAQAAHDLAQGTGDEVLLAQCKEVLTKIQVGLKPVTGRDG